MENMSMRIAVRITLITLMIAVVGTAAAESVVVSPANQNLPPGQSTSSGVYVTYTIDVTNILNLGSNHTIKANITGFTSGGSYSDLKFRFNHGTLSSDWLDSGATWNWIDDGTGNDSLTVDVIDTSSVQDVVYQFKVYDEYPDEYGFSDNAQATVYGVSIPEFPTIALPIAALIGLMFIFSTRRRE